MRKLPGKLIPLIVILSFGLFHASAQNANPYISMATNPSTVSVGSNSTLQIISGNAGSDNIVMNSLEITVTVGFNAEILGIAAGSDTRWSQFSLTPGAGGTIKLRNTGPSPFTSFDLGYVNVTIRGVNAGGPAVITGNIAYVIGPNPALGGLQSSSQGNTNNMDDNATTSLTVSGPCTPQTLYHDNDGDGYGAGPAVTQCMQSGLVTISGDCDDTKSSVHPNAAEICDGLDNNCDGIVDDNCNANPYINLQTFPPTVTVGMNSNLQVSAGNAGSGSIVANSLEITITVGNNAEIIGIGPGSDARWTQTMLTSGTGGTIKLRNTGVNSFGATDLGHINVTIKGTAPGGPYNISGNIAYIPGPNPLLGGASSHFQGNSSITDDNSVASLVVTPGTSVCTPYFQKQYGGPSQEAGERVAITSDGGYIIVGYTTSYGHGNWDGLITRTDKNGHTIWSKAVGGANEDYLYAIKNTSDNGFIIVGQTKSYGNPSRDAWLIKLDQTGNIQWSQRYGDSNSFGVWANEVIELSGGGFCFSGIYNYVSGLAESMVVRTDNNGNVVWSKVYPRNNSDGAWGMTEDGNSLVVAGYYYAGSYYDGYLMKLDKATGSVEWIRTYDAEFRSTWMARVAVTQNGYQVFSPLTDDFGSTNQNQVVWNIASDGTVQNIRKIHLSSTNQTTSLGWLPLNDGGFIVANGILGSNADPIYTKVNADGTVAWSKKFEQAGYQSIYRLLATPSGGFAAIGVSGMDIYFSVLDENGNAGNCSGIPTSEVLVSSTSYTGSSQTIFPYSTSLTQPLVSVSTINFTPVEVTNCSYCDTPPETCADGNLFFQKQYGGPGNEEVESIAPTIDNGYMMVGYSNSYGTGSLDATVQKLDKEGNLIWSRTIGGDGDDQLYNIKRTADNGFIAIGQSKSYSNGDAWLVRMDANGNILWSKVYGDGGINEWAYEVIELSDGGFCFVGSKDYLPGSAESFAARTDAMGNLIWSKRYGHSGSDAAYGIAEDGSSLLVCGYYQGVSYYEGSLMKIDKATGNLQWIRGYDAESYRAMRMYRIKVTPTSYQIFSLVIDDYSSNNQQQCIWNLNKDGSVQNVRKVLVPGIQTSGYGSISMDDGGFLVANGVNHTDADIIYTRVNSGGNILWSKKYAKPGYQSIYKMIEAPQGGYTSVGADGIANRDAYLQRIDANGNAGNCSGVETSEITVVTPPFSVYQPSISSQDFPMYTNMVVLNQRTFTPATTSYCVECAPVVVCVKPTIMYQHEPGGQIQTVNNDQPDASESIQVSLCDGQSYSLSGMVHSHPTNRYKFVFTASGGSVHFNGAPAANADINAAQFSSFQHSWTATLLDPNVSGTVVMVGTPYKDINGNNVLDNGDCTGDPFTVTYSVGSAQIMLVQDEVYMHRNQVYGNVGVWGVGKYAKFREYTNVYGSVQASNITVDATSTISGARINSPAAAPDPSTFRYNREVDPTTDITIPDNYVGEYVLTGDHFRKITVGKNSTVRFQNTGTIYIKEFYSKYADVGRTTVVRFSGPTQLLVRYKMDLGKRTHFNPDDHPLQVYYELNDLKVGASSIINSSVDVRFKNIVLEDAIETLHTVMKGRFIAKKIDSKKWVDWMLNCSAGSSLTNLITSNRSESLITNSENQFSVRVSPNPSNNDFRFEVSSSSKAPFTLRIFDVSGKQVKSVLNNGNNVINTGKELIPGIYFAEINQGAERKTVKLIKL